MVYDYVFSPEPVDGHLDDRYVIIPKDRTLDQKLL